MRRRADARASSSRWRGARALTTDGETAAKIERGSTESKLRPRPNAFLNQTKLSARPLVGLRHTPEGLEKAASPTLSRCFWQ
jgi:hypothetical protein